ncbi:MAG: nucleoside monophosphate kinase [Candidatus Dojkabacteria bacterium]|nr:nucleoside monophosphate kinase [Candidatus Dojkabacteria bacterium]MDQ7020664.1 nucleoside monophosphate kinase [Candidatus Dojkabacteria bacterium]
MENLKYKTIVVLGILGAGKDTQAELLEKKLGYTIISSGEVLRQKCKADKEFCNKVQHYQDSGDLVPNEIVFDVLKENLDKHVDENLLLTGVVRRFPQVEMLDKILKDSGRKLDLVVFLELSDEDAIDRLSKRVYDPKTGKTYHMEFNPPAEGIEVKRRADDEPESIKLRLVRYHEAINGILDEYEKRSILLRVSAKGNINEISDSLVDFLKK